MKTKQIVVRTYPNCYTIETAALEKALADGYKVVMCNTFVINANGTVTGNEYILEKEESE